MVTVASPNEIQVWGIQGLLICPDGPRKEYYS